MRIHIPFSREREVIYNHQNQVYRKWFIFIIWHKEKMNETNGYMSINES
jgi:hypothetical protein